VGSWGSFFNSETIAQGRKQGKCILLWMAEAISTRSHEARPGHLGPFRPIGGTNVAASGCEYLPKSPARRTNPRSSAKHVHLRSQHGGGTYLMHTGYRKP
jgi:hypothetical protein